MEGLYMYLGTGMREIKVPIVAACMIGNMKGTASLPIGN